ncbi:hypothetical protein Peur_027366 [Populus x canadensis]
MACQGTCACSVEVPKKEEVSTQPETVVQEDSTTAVAPEEVKTEEKDASSAQKEEEPVKAEVGSTTKLKMERKSSCCPGRSNVRPASGTPEEEPMLTSKKGVIAENAKIETPETNKPSSATPAVTVKTEEKPAIFFKIDNPVKILKPGWKRYE